MILYELSLEASRKYTDTVKLIDNKRYYYVDKHGKTLRHAKIVFKSEKLQDELVKEWRYHDPTKEQDKCIEVLLGKIGGKWYPISTVRKLDVKCIKRHAKTYAEVPIDVYRKALSFIDDNIMSKEEKKEILNTIQSIKKITGIRPERDIEKPIIIRSKKDLERLKK